LGDEHQGREQVTAAESSPMKALQGRTEAPMALLDQKATPMALSLVLKTSPGQRAALKASPLVQTASPGQIVAVIA
jgi:hypothetical protein